MENEPPLLEAIAFDGPLLGSDAAAICTVRDPMTLPSLPPTKRLRFCKVRTRASPTDRLSRWMFGQRGRTRFLHKPIHSACGVRIEWWDGRGAIAAGHYLQRHIRGKPLGAVFHADGWSSVLLGVTEQFIGEREFAGKGFRY